MRFGFYLDVHVLCKKMDSFECYRSYLSYFYKLSTSQGLPIVPKPIFFFGLAAGPTSLDSFERLEAFRTLGKVIVKW